MTSNQKKVLDTLKSQGKNVSIVNVKTSYVDYGVSPVGNDTYPYVYVVGTKIAVDGVVLTNSQFDKLVRV